MLIGGGEVGRGNTPYETKAIDEAIVKMSGKEHPNVLFVGLASSFSDSYYDVIKKIYKELGCTPVYLKKNNLIHNPDLVKQKFQDADIIYVGGGDTIKLLEKIEEYNLKPYFDEACKNNTVLAGISAGAILFSKEGYSDAYLLRGEKDTYEFIKGFGYANISITPHYHADINKTKQLEEALKKKSGSIYGLENGCALMIDDDQMTVISSISGAKAYKVSYLDQLFEKEL